MTNEQKLEMLKAAAKAVGIGPVLCAESRRTLLRIGTRESYKLWNPLSDDGDAARLDSAMLFKTSFHAIAVIVNNFNSDGGTLSELAYYADHNNDRDAAHRFASTKLAAIIGGWKE